MLDGGEYSPSEFAESYSCMNNRKKKSKNKSRFSDEQIKSLESMFKNETRLEPRKKVQLAKELGLQPRQVAIWFQNKRARWKSKQLERDYSILRANYNSLASHFESLKKEKQALVNQLQKLNEQIQSPREERQCCGQGVGGNSSDGESENGDNTNNDSEGKPSMSFERSEHGGLGVLSDDDSSIKPDQYFGLEEEPNLMSIADGSLTSQEGWEGFESDGLFDQSSSEYQWWDFWAN